MSTIVRTEVANPPAGASPGKLAGAVAGILYGIAAALILGMRMPWNQQKVTVAVMIGAGAGLILGMIFGRFRSITAAAIAGGILPLVLIVNDALRRGRLQAKDLNDPNVLLIMAGIVAAGATTAALLNATAKGLRRLWD